MPNTPKMSKQEAKILSAKRADNASRREALLQGKSDPRPLTVESFSRDKKLSNVLQAGERGADKAVSKIMKNVPGSSGPPKGLVDALEPAIRYLGRRSRGENTDKKAAGGVVKPRGYGMARGGKACKMM